MLCKQIEYIKEIFRRNVKLCNALLYFHTGNIMKERVARWYCARAVNDVRNIAKTFRSQALYKLGKICAIYGEDSSIENSELCNNRRESRRRGEHDVLFASHCSSGWQRDIPAVRDAEGRGKGEERKIERDGGREQEQSSKSRYVLGCRHCPAKLRIATLTIRRLFQGLPAPNGLAPPPSFTLHYLSAPAHIYTNSAFQPSSRKLLNSLLMLPMARTKARAPFRAS